MNGIEALDNLKSLTDDTEPDSLAEQNFDDLIGGQNEKIKYVNKRVAIVDLVPSPKNPYKVATDTDEYMELKKSIEMQGIITPLIVKEIDDGRYEILSGERRYTCAKELGIHLIDVRVAQDITEEDEDLIISFSNKYRANKKPSELAKDIELSYNAIKRKQGGDTRSSDYEQKPWCNDCTMEKLEDETTRTRDIIAEELGISSRTVMNYLRIAKLSPAWLNAIDGKMINMKQGIAISYIDPIIQEMLYTISTVFNGRLKIHTNKCKLEIDDFKKIQELTYSEEFKDVIKGEIKKIVNERIDIINNTDNEVQIKKEEKKAKQRKKIIEEIRKELFKNSDKESFSKEEVLEMLANL